MDNIQGFEDKLADRMRRRRRLRLRRYDTAMEPYLLSSIISGSHNRLRRSFGLDAFSPSGRHFLASLLRCRCRRRRDTAARNSSSAFLLYLENLQRESRRLRSNPLLLSSFLTRFVAAEFVTAPLDGFPFARMGKLFRSQRPTPFSHLKVGELYLFV